MDWKHDELAEDLATAKGGIPFLNACLGSAWASGKTPRADLVVCRPSYTRWCLSIFEIKISRSDFLSDIRSGKWRSYLPHCHRFYFAVARGVLTVKDVPEEAGLIIRGPKGWSTRRAAPQAAKEIPSETLLSLVFAKQRRSVRELRLDDVMAMAKDSWHRCRQDFGGRLKAARVLGDKMGQLHEAAMQLGGLDEGIAALKAAKSKPWYMKEQPQEAV